MIQNRSISLSLTNEILCGFCHFDVVLTDVVRSALRMKIRPALMRWSCERLFNLDLSGK